MISKNNSSLEIIKEKTEKKTLTDIMSNKRTQI